jgi:hypothetical protein
MEERFVAYYRVSTQQQGRSGLGLDAQRQAVSAYLGERAYRLLNEYTEVETGKGSNALDRRPQLRAAMDACKRHNFDNFFSPSGDCAYRRERNSLSVATASVRARWRASASCSVRRLR